MANDEHVKILEEGVVVWNRWREEHAGMVSGADLTRANLNRAELDRRLDAGEITQEEYDRRRAEGWTVE